MIDFDAITRLSASPSEPSPSETRGLLAKARSLTGLTLDEASRLLAVADPAMRDEVRAAALDVKRRVFGDRIVLFAPLYLSNECANRCLYCGFQSTNHGEKRKTLSIDEAVGEARFLTGRGFRRTLLVCAENKARCSVEYVAAVTRAIYDKTPMRIVHLNAAPMDAASLRTLRAAGVGVFQVFQETYHRETYERLHVAGAKQDFFNRLTCMDRAVEAGFRDLGIGALLGLYDHRFDVLATIAHALYCRDTLGTAPHTISVPRFRRAEGAALSAAPYPVDDATFLLIVAVYRLAVPTAGIVVSTREPAAIRDAVLSWGASQISAESSTAPGGYTGVMEKGEGTQFSLNDTRPLEEIVTAILDRGMLPSFCAACYTRGREGGRFHELAASGAMRTFCERNARVSFMEYIAGRNDGPLRDELRRKFAAVAGIVADEPEAGILA